MLQYIFKISVFLIVFVVWGHLSAEVDANPDGWSQQPQQIHIAYAIDQHDCMMVTWNTEKSTPTSTAIYWRRDGGEKMTAHGKALPFIDQGEEHRKQFIHHVAMCSLVSGEVYEYYVGDATHGWSAPAHFHAKITSNNWHRPLVLAVYGDLGDANSQSLAMIESSAYSEEIDAVLHVGDFAYDLHDENGRVGDRFMNDIQPVASILPYMTCPGNHELYDNFNHYRNRYGRSFTTDFSEHLHYSFHLANVHIVSMNTEMYFRSIDEVKIQYEWLEKDLIKANQEREQRPWIITIGHRPTYCSNDNQDDCTKLESLVRKGFKQKDGTYLYGLEELLFKHGVDLSFWGHEHSYERFKPMYKGTVMGEVHSKDGKDVYVNPAAPVNIITGSAGCREKHNPFKKESPSWSASRFRDYGFGVLKVNSDTHLSWTQYSIDQGGIGADSVVIEQHSHGPFSQQGIVEDFVANTE